MVNRGGSASALGWTRVKLTGSDIQKGNLFGFSVAVSGDVVVVDSSSYGCIEGGAYVFVKPSGGWQNMAQTAKLTGSDFGPCGGSGFDEVAISDNTIVAGPGPSGDTIYVFVKPEGGWKDMTETARLTTSVNLYGVGPLAISGNTIVAGYFLAYGTGAAAVFVEPAGGWGDMTQTAILTASNGEAGDQFGSSVAIAGRTLAAGSPSTKGDGASSGAIYVFVEPTTGWANASQTAELTAGYSLGSAIGISGETIASDAASGADVFEEPSGGWTNLTSPTATLEPPANVNGFGSVAISGKAVVAGLGEWPNFYDAYGAVFAYLEPSGGWQTTSSPNGSYYGSPSGGAQQIGYSVAISGNTMVAGAAWYDDGVGIAYLFAPK